MKADDKNFVDEWKDIFINNQMNYMPADKACRLLLIIDDLQNKINQAILFKGCHNCQSCAPCGGGIESVQAVLRE